MSDAAGILPGLFNKEAHLSALKTTTTLSFKDVKNGVSGKGPWALSIFAAGDGRDYTTLDPALASKIQSLDGQLLEVAYSERKNGQFTNYSVEGVEVAAAGATAAPVDQSAGTYKRRDPQETLQIHRQSALDRALTAFGIAQVDPIESLDALFQLSDTFVVYFTEGSEAAVEAASEVAA